MNSRRMKWRTTLWIMVGIQAFGVGSFFLALPFIPFQIEQLGIHDPSAVAFWSGIVFSINALTGALFAPLWGDVADRIGRKKMVVRSSIFGGLTAALMGFSPNIWVLTTSRALMGVAGGFTSAAAALVGRVVYYDFSHVPCLASHCCFCITSAAFVPAA